MAFGITESCRWLICPVTLYITVFTSKVLFICLFLWILSELFSLCFLLLLFGGIRSHIVWVVPELVGLVESSDMTTEIQTIVPDLTVGCCKIRHGREGMVVADSMVVGVFSWDSTH